MQNRGAQLKKGVKRDVKKCWTQFRWFFLLKWIESKWVFDLCLFSFTIFSMNCMVCTWPVIANVIRNKPESIVAIILLFNLLWASRKTVEFVIFSMAMFLLGVVHGVCFFSVSMYVCILLFYSLSHFLSCTSYDK